MKTDNASILERTVLECGIKVGQFLQENAFDIKNTEWKEKDDPVTDLDKKAEEMIREYIGKALKVNFYGEEYGLTDNGSNINIYIDPIDGTKSFLRGEYLSSLSIAADIDGKMAIGVVNDFMRGLLYYANNNGAYVKIINRNTEKALPTINTTFSRPTITFNRDTIFRTILSDTINARNQIGSVALSMAQLAAGSHDGLIMAPYQKNGLMDVCDIAAGYFVMEKAGIIITDYYGRKYNHLESLNSIVAYKPNIDKEIVSKILETQIRMREQHDN